MKCRTCGSKIDKPKCWCCGSADYLHVEIKYKNGSPKKYICRKCWKHSDLSSRLVRLRHKR